MGEKIRNIHPLHLGKNEYMVELNEGYSEKQGYVIHIQNKYFRYLLKENDFFQFAAEILRSNSELAYIKDHPVHVQDERTFKRNTPQGEESKAQINRLCKMLTDRNIRYRLIDAYEGYLSVLINNNDYQAFSKLCKEDGFQKKQHPLGRLFDYVFLYQMRPFELYMYQGALLVDCMFQLPCASLTPKTWIPLDRAIQKYVWENELIVDEKLWLDNVSLFIFQTAWSVFYCKGFSKESREKLCRCLREAAEEKLHELLKLVFFSYSARLLELSRAEQFDEIIKEYYTYREY